MLRQFIRNLVDLFSPFTIARHYFLPLKTLNLNIRIIWEISVYFYQNIIVFYLPLAFAIKVVDLFQTYVCQTHQLSFDLIVTYVFHSNRDIRFLPFFLSRINNFRLILGLFIWVFVLNMSIDCSQRAILFATWTKETLCLEAFFIPWFVLVFWWIRFLILWKLLGFRWTISLFFRWHKNSI